LSCGVVSEGMSSFKDRFAKKISVFNKDGCTSRIDKEGREDNRQVTMYTVNEEVSPPPRHSRGAPRSSDRAADRGQGPPSGSRKPAVSSGSARGSGGGHGGGGYASKPASSGSYANKHRKSTSASDSYGAGGGYGEAAARSRKARDPIDYTPHTYAEYQAKCQPGKWEKLGKLGPDMMDDDLIEKRAQKERIKEYSRNLRVQNAQIIDYSKQMQPMPVEKDVEVKEPTKREKMIQYAAHVPKPKAKKKASEKSEDDGYDGARPDGPMSVLAELEARHRQDQQAVAAIRREMCL